MLCQRCQRHLRSCEGVKCGQCESRYHLRCVGDARDRSAGDRAYQWKCALCNNSETKVHFENIPSKEDALLGTITAISEKIELVNKIQLPKLCSDLLQLKSLTDNIFKQNENILRKIDEFEKKENTGANSRVPNYHRRNGNLVTKKSFNCTERNDNVPMLPLAEKTVRYRPRRRSYLLNKMFHLLNRKLQRSTTPRKRS